MASTSIRVIRSTFCAAMLGIVAAGALAQSYPSKPISIVVPFAPGSGSDSTARAIAQEMGPVLGQPVIVENRTGAGGTVGAGVVARSAPDGYTILLSSISNSVTASTMKLPYDFVTSFADVTMVGTQPYVLVVPLSLPADSLRNLIALAKLRPGEFNFGTVGIGSLGHLQWESVKAGHGVDIVHIPYKGTSDALVDMVAGRVHMLLIPLPAGLPQVKAGKVRALAVSGNQRVPALPDVPTTQEAGFPELKDSVWYAFLVPAGTPDNIVRKINAAYAKILTKPEVMSQLSKLGIDAKSSTPEETTAFIKAQVEKWRIIVASAPYKFGL